MVVVEGRKQAQGKEYKCNCCNEVNFPAGGMQANDSLRAAAITWRCHCCVCQHTLLDGVKVRLHGVQHHQVPFLAGGQLALTRSLHAPRQALKLATAALLAPIPHLRSVDNAHTRSIGSSRQSTVVKDRKQAAPSLN